ncbi:hypothetical protein V6N12_004768 [Hibiscus sabdariffa]|uniref:Uncharacterized protein n=1 Tax=Hibiscus sabdariffa TaxID=183260 RepID=A0ABR2CMH6_9ROSI
MHISMHMLAELMALSNVVGDCNNGESVVHRYRHFIQDLEVRDIKQMTVVIYSGPGYRVCASRKASFNVCRLIWESERTCIVLASKMTNKFTPKTAPNQSRPL